jgi:5-methylthioribose kinase
MELLADRQAEIESRLRTLAWIAPDEPVLALEPPGAGNMNRILRACLPTRTMVLKQAVPFVARYPQIPAPVERLQVEATFYRLIARQDALSLRTPRVLGEDPANHLLCLEDLGTQGDMTWLYRPPAAGARPALGGQLTALVYWLWKLHALDLQPGRGPAELAPCMANPAMRALNHAHIFEIPFAADNGVELAGPLRALQRELAADLALRDRAAALGRIYLGNADHASADVLLHGDYYPGSWLTHPTMGVMIIDPEFSFIGAPEFDVGVLMAHLTMAGFNQTEVGMQLRSYMTPPGFSYPLALAFAGMEIIRRLLGVAQLPLATDTATRAAWLQTARALVTAPEVLS